MRTKEMSRPPAEFAAAEAMFLTNSVRLVVPVARLDRRRYAADHPVLARFANAIGARIAAECGRDPRADRNRHSRAPTPPSVERT
jgi:branched-chain amino acid aminotransferase